MQVKQLQEKIVQWVTLWDEKRNVAPTQEHTIMHLVEEVGELSAQYVNLEQRQDKYEPAEIENAIGDILIQLFKLAHLRNLDVETIITNIFEKEKFRLTYENK